MKLLSENNLGYQLNQLLQQAQTAGLFTKNCLVMQDFFHSDSGALNIIEIKADSHEGGFKVEVCRVSSLADNPLWSTKLELPLNRNLTQAEQYAANQAIGILHNNLQAKSPIRG